MNAALISRCEHFSILHKRFDELRMHHELHEKPDLVICHNIDYALLGKNLIGCINNLKREECLRPNAIILPSAARVWVMGVEVLTETGVPVHMQARRQPALLFSRRQRAALVPLGSRAAHCGAAPDCNLTARLQPHRQIATSPPDCSAAHAQSAYPPPTPSWLKRRGLGASRRATATLSARPGLVSGNREDVLVAGRQENRHGR